MQDIRYVDLAALNPAELMDILNSDSVREHLVQHGKFNVKSLASWLADKARVDAKSGCTVRGITVNGAAAGWCGIQQENEAFEIAIVLDAHYWGIGPAVFKELMSWAAQFGHTTVLLHLLSTRREYRFLRKRALRTFDTQLYGANYTTYELSVNSAIDGLV